MSIDFDIFVKTDEPLDVFVESIGTVLGMSFQLASPSKLHDFTTYFALNGVDLNLSVREHSLECDDEEPRFCDYRYKISVYVYNTNSDPFSKEREYGFEVYNKLMRYGGYSILYIEQFGIVHGIHDKP